VTLRNRKSVVLVAICPVSRLIRHWKLARNFEKVSRRSTESLLVERLPQFDFVTVGIVYPGEAAVAFVLALRVDADAFFR